MITADPDCETCGGTGETFIDFARFDGSHATEQIVCPVCAGYDPERDDPPEPREDEQRECETESPL